MLSDMSIQEIKTEIEALPPEERKRLAAFLVSLRHKELDEYRASMAQKIDDKNPENWATLDELDQRLES
jgi:DNA-binding transcriptional MerR regulator